MSSRFSKSNKSSKSTIPKVEYRGDKKRPYTGSRFWTTNPNQLEYRDGEKRHFTGSRAWSTDPKSDVARAKPNGCILM